MFGNYRVNRVARRRGSRFYAFIKRLICLKEIAQNHFGEKIQIHTKY